MSETLWKFQTRNLLVEWTIHDDYDVDTSFDDTGEIDRLLESGKMVAFQSEIVVTHKATGAVLGRDYLGGSIYENPEEFRDHLGRNAKGYGSYFSQMVREACREARNTLRDIQNIPVR